MVYKDITKYSSPWFTPAAQVAATFGMGRKVRSLTIHHWGNRGQDPYGIINFFCDGTRDPRTATSAHYVVWPGNVACVVDPDNAAWHAGNSAGNATSIGLELRPEATDADYAVAAELIRDLRKVYGDVPLIPHKSWSSTACPGVWDLKRLDRLARGTSPAKKPTKEEANVADKGNVKEWNTWAFRNPAVEKAKDAYALLRGCYYGIQDVLKIVKEIRAAQK